MHDHSQHLCMLTNLNGMEPLHHPASPTYMLLQLMLMVVVLVGKLDFDTFASIFKAPSQV